MLRTHSGRIEFTLLGSEVPGFNLMHQLDNPNMSASLRRLLMLDYASGVGRNIAVIAERAAKPWRSMSIAQDFFLHLGW